ncbi:hypothetical protein Tco_1174415 [Tanacetum coccineum]
MSYTKVVYDGWMVRYGTRTIGWLFLHMRYFVPESRLLAYYKRKPQDNVVPIKTLVIDGNCRVDDRGFKTQHGHVHFVIRIGLRELISGRRFSFRHNKNEIEIVVDKVRKVRHTNVVQFIEACTKPFNLCIVTDWNFGMEALEVHSDLEILIISYVSYILCLQKYSDLEVLEVIVDVIRMLKNQNRVLQSKYSTLLLTEENCRSKCFYDYWDSGEKKMSLVNDVAVLFVMGYDEFTIGNFFCIIWYRRRDYENGVKAIESVPSLENVTVCFGMVIDEHFSSLYMRVEFNEEVKSIEIVNSLASEARICCTLANLNANLKNR